MLDVSQPLYILELGAGTGKLAFLLFRHLLSMLSEIHIFHKLSIRYIISVRVCYAQTWPNREKGFY